MWECSQRRENRVKRSIRAAALEDLDFSDTQGLDRRFILELGQSHWVASHQNILIFSPTGGGNSFLATAFGVAAARLGFTVRHHRTTRLLHALTNARQGGSLIHLLRALAKTNLLVLDDWMRDTISVLIAQDILEVLDDRFCHSVTLFASQVPLTDWHLRIPDPILADTILDRQVHNIQRIHLEGESQRKIRSKRSMPNT